MSKPTLVELRTAAGPLPRIQRRRDPDDGLRALLRAHLQQLMWTTIETGAVAGGVADCNWLAPGGREGWIECKATRASAVRFRPGQVGWLLRRARMGGVVHVAVRRRSAGSTRLQGRDELWLVHGTFAPRVAELGLRADVPWFVTAGGPNRWDWYHVLRLLDGGAARLTPTRPGEGSTRRGEDEHERKKRTDGGQRRSGGGGAAVHDGSMQGR